MTDTGEQTDRHLACKEDLHVLMELSEMMIDTLMGALYRYTLYGIQDSHLTLLTVLNNYHICALVPDTIKRTGPISHLFFVLE